MTLPWLPCVRLELGDLVLTPALPLGAPAPSYTSSVLGYTEHCQQD